MAETKARKKPPIKWRKLFRVTHRDVGYVVVALTLAYSVSGVAVNHIDDWNPNYRFEESSFSLQDLRVRGEYPDIDLDALREETIQRLEVDPKLVRGHFLESPSRFQVFMEEGGEIVLDPKTGRGEIKRVIKRPGLYEFNVLHLNTLKGTWTYIADLFALSLIFLTLTGMFMNKGKTGLGGRGKWFVGAGLLLPAAFIVSLYL